MKKITCRELAQRLGLHPSTVSLALRHHPSIPSKTRERIKALADELGYRPDPALAALNAYRTAKCRVEYKATLGWIDSAPESDLPRRFEAIFQGAKCRALEFGYHIEYFQAFTKSHWQRLPRTLKSRGIEGILLPPPPKIRDLEGLLAFPWHDFHAVVLAEDLELPLHLVINNQFQGAALTVRELHALGYRKIGMIMPSYFALHTGFQFFGGYVSECARLGIHALPFLDDSPTESLLVQRTVQWMERNQPEVLIAPGKGDILPALNGAKLCVPRDVALAVLSRDPEHPEISGIDQNDRQIGVEGANQLIDLLRRNERGAPEFRMHHLVEGRWVAADSTPPKGNIHKKNPGKKSKPRNRPSQME